MKRLNKKAIITHICCLFVLFVVVLGSSKVLAHENSSSIYPDCLQIIELNRNHDIVYAQTSTGLIFSFYGVEDYAVGDLVAVIMDDNGTTETVLDDKVIDCRYAGYFEN